jgi:enoyl-CoA hydratase/carnithine racemase
VTTASTVRVDREGPTAWITLERPHRLNAITVPMARELLAAFTSLGEDDSVRVIVLRGSGRAFCAGLDLDEAFRADPGPGVPYHEGPTEESLLPDIIRAMRRCPQPVVALVHGPACGGGFAFALAADVRIAGASARMNVAFVNLGVSGCELGVSYFLPRQVGLSVAAELMYTGRFIDAARAKEIGLVSQVVPDDELEDAGRALVADMLNVAPLALRKTKETLGRAVDLTDLDDVLELEEATQRECMRGPHFQEGLRAFAEKRAPRFTPE